MSTEKHVRSVRFTPEIHQKLISICDSFGVTPNSYILHAVGRALSQDYTSIHSQQNSTDAYQMLGPLFAQFQHSLDEKLSLSDDDQSDLFENGDS